MKRILFGALVLGVILAPSLAYAAYRSLPWTNNIYNVSDTDLGYGDTVSVFDDEDNKCYIVSGARGGNSSPSSTISCVKN